MQSSLTFIFRDVDGVATPGATITLRSSADNFTTNVYTLTESSTKPGVYEISADEMPFGLYKAWVNGSEDKSFGGTYGKPMGNPFVTFPKKEDLQSVNTTLTNSISSLNTSLTGSINGVNTSLTNAVSTINTSLAGKAGLSTHNTFTGNNTFQGITSIVAPVSTDYADPELDSVENNLITNARLEYKLAHMQGYAESANYVRIAPGVAPQTGKVYHTIQAGVASFGTPSLSNTCKVFIQGMGTAAAYIVPGATALRNYVNLISADKSVVISFPNVNTSEIVTIENATVVLGGGTLNGGSGSARIWTNVKFINCRIYHFKNFTLKGGLLERCTVLSPDGIKFIPDKDGSDVYTDILGSIFRVEPEISEEVPYLGCADFTLVENLKVIDDFTIDSEE